MKAILALLAAAGIGGWLLLGKKKTVAASTSTVVIPASTIKTPVGNVAVTAPTATTPGSVTVTPPPSDVPGIMPANVVAALESDSPDDLYRTGMASNDKIYVAAAATRLAQLSDTRAMDLTLRVANWGS